MGDLLSGVESWADLWAVARLYPAEMVLVGAAALSLLLLVLLFVLVVGSLLRDWRRRGRAAAELAESEFARGVAKVGAR